MIKPITKPQRSKFFLVTSLLCLITVLFFTQTDAYISGDINLLPGYQKQGLLQLTKSDQGAEVTNNEVWRLSNTQATQTSWIDLDINPPSAHDALYLSADLKATIESQKNTDRRTVANLMLLSADHNKNWNYQLAHLLTVVKSTQDWTHYGAGFKQDSDATRYRISANLSGLTGSFLIKNIALYPAEKNAFFSAGYYSLLLSWILLLLFPGAWLAKHIRNLYEYWPLLGVLALILTGILLPADLKYSLLNQVHALINSLGIHFPVPGTDARTHHPGRPALALDKTGHLIAFAAAGFILTWNARVSYKEYLPALILFAVTTETLQYFIPNRNPLLMDAAIDITGIIAGTSLAYLVKRGARLSGRSRT